MPTIDDKNRLPIEYTQAFARPDGNITVEITVSPPCTQAEKMPARAKLCFQKVFCEDWRFSERMFEILWKDFENEFGL
jgi:hypothetical protein